MSRNALASSNAYQGVSNTHGLTYSRLNSRTIDYQAEFSNATPTGFDVTTRTGTPPAGTSFGYAAFSGTGTGGVVVDVANSPNSTTVDWEVSTPGITPKYVFMLPTLTSNYMTTQLDFHLTVGMGCSDFSEESAVAIMSRSSTSPSSTRTLYNTRFIQMMDINANINYDVRTAVSNGFKVAAGTIDAASSTNVLWPFLAFG